MKNKVTLSVVLVAVVTAMTTNAAWTYDPAAGTLTDGVWTLNATLVSGTSDQLDVNGSQAVYAGAADGRHPIDFTEIKDGSGNSYKAVSFATLKSDVRVYLNDFIAPDCVKLSVNGCLKDSTSLTNVQLSAEFSNFQNDRPFQGCTSLVTFFPRILNISDMRADCFHNCSKLEGDFVFPVCPTFKTRCFAGCSSITSVSMPSATQIWGAAFSGCSKLHTVEVSDALQSIESTCFSGCASLSSDSVRGILHKGLKRMGNSDGSDIKNFFQNCTSLDGKIEWYFPELTSTNVIGQNFFNGCTNLETVVFKTDVLEIRGGAFVDLAPAVEIYMPLNAPLLVGDQSICNKKGLLSPRIYLQGNYEEWYDVLGENHHFMLKSDFNNSDWSDAVNQNFTRTRQNVVDRMKIDTDICEIDVDGNVVLKKKRVLAFMMRKHTGNNSNSFGCWIFSTPEKGFNITVR